MKIEYTVECEIGSYDKNVIYEKDYYTYQLSKINENAHYYNNTMENFKSLFYILDNKINYIHSNFFKTNIIFETESDNFTLKELIDNANMKLKDTPNLVFSQTKIVPAFKIIK